VISSGRGAALLLEVAREVACGEVSVAGLGGRRGAIGGRTPGDVSSAAGRDCVGCEPRCVGDVRIWWRAGVSGLLLVVGGWR